jgi:hypothetical protein
MVRLATGHGVHLGLPGGGTDPGGHDGSGMPLWIKGTLYPRPYGRIPRNGSFH